MKIFTEKEAEPFLEKNGFNIVSSTFVGTKKELFTLTQRIGFPLVMKISGKDILHKKKIGGVKLDINSLKEAEETFLNFNKMNKNQGAIIQKQIKGKEFLLGIKDTEDFGKAIAFGVGGSNVEKIKKVVFRISPITRHDAEEMVKEINSSLKMNKKEQNIVKKNLIKLSKLAGKYLLIKELDINPLIVEDNKAFVVDARIIFS